MHGRHNIWQLSGSVLPPLDHGGCGRPPSRRRRRPFAHRIAGGIAVGAVVAASRRCGSRTPAVSGSAALETQRVVLPRHTGVEDLRFALEGGDQLPSLWKLVHTLSLPTHRVTAYGNQVPAGDGIGAGIVVSCSLGLGARNTSATTNASAPNSNRNASYRGSPAGSWRAAVRPRLT